MLLTVVGGKIVYQDEKGWIELSGSRLFRFLWS